MSADDAAAIENTLRVKDVLQAHGWDEIRTISSLLAENQRLEERVVELVEGQALQALTAENQRLRDALEIAEPYIDCRSARGAAAATLVKQALAAVRVEGEKLTQTDADGRVVWEGYPPDESAAVRVEDER